MLAENKNCRCICIVEIEDDCFVVADEYRIGQVFSNLINNALKYLDCDNPSIEIRCSQNEEAIQIQVKDNGPGIAESDLPFIFDRKYKGSGAGAANYGLGLYISKEILTHHGGNISVKNNDGEGCSFYFTLPCYTINSP